MQKCTLTILCWIIAGLIVLFSGCETGTTPWAGRISVRLTSAPSSFDGHTLSFGVTEEGLDDIIGKGQFVIANGAGRAAAGSADRVVTPKLFEINGYDIMGVVDLDDDAVVDSSDQVFVGSVSLIDNVSPVLELTASDFGLVSAIAPEMVGHEIE